MAYYKDLPIWRDAMRLAVEMELAVRGFPRYHKYTRGTELRQAAHLICQEVAHAALWAPLRLQTLQRLVERIEALKISVQRAKELRAFANFAQFQRVVELAVLVGRQSGGWLKRVRGLGHLWLKNTTTLTQICAVVVSRVCDNRWLLEPLPRLPAFGAAPNPIKTRELRLRGNINPPIQRILIRSSSVKIPAIFYRLVAVTSLALFAPWAAAQTCVAGIQASNPASVYVVDSANGTVTDTRTGLMWDRCARGLSGVGCATGTASTFTWQAALNAAATIGAYKGYNDWRLPNLRELHSLVEECRLNPSINEFTFPNTPAWFFWSGSPSAGVATFAWFVGFSGGNVGIGDRSSAFQVRLVRAGQ